MSEKCIRKIEIKHKNEPFPENIKCLMKLRRKVNKEVGRASYNPDKKKELRRLEKDLAKEINSLLGKHNSEELKRRLLAVNTSRNVFQNINKLSGRKSRPRGGTFIDNDKQIDDDEEKAECFKRYYRGIYQAETPDCDQLDQVRAADRRITRYENDLNFSATKVADNRHRVDENLTNMWELMERKKELNNKKSASFDEISNYIIRKMPAVFWAKSAIIFNHCIRNCYFPKAWKRARIIPLAKKTNASCAEEFRPISLLSNWGKMLEDVIHKNMRKCNENLGIPPYQFGFKRGNNTSDKGSIIINDRIINKSEKIKYLGLIISEKCDGKGKVENAIRRGGSAFGQLKWLIRNKIIDHKVKAVIVGYDSISVALEVTKERERRIEFSVE